MVTSSGSLANNKIKLSANKSIKVTNTNSNSITNTNINSDKMPPKPWVLCWFCNTKGDHFATHCPDLTDEQKVRLIAEREKMNKNKKFNKKISKQTEEN